MVTTARVGPTQACEDCRSSGCSWSTLLKGEAWASYLRAKSVHRFRARQTMFHQGTPAFTVYILCQGDVKLSVAGPSGTNRIIRLVSASCTPGEILDKGSLGAPVHTMTCETLTPCHVCCLAKSDLVWLMRQEQEMADRILSAVSAELGELLERFREGPEARMRQRLAKILVGLAERHGVPAAHGIAVDLALSRQEWADLVGTTRETITRLFHALHREGVLSLHGKGITILRYEQLSRLAL